ncbi:MAG TPA: beta-phosphoglucomutase family hydrolase [Thermomicrobiales bacterium]|nr:beta-phosphoglucomutase family hydrolase [Thermomicrobiales bacterium]
MSDTPAQPQPVPKLPNGIHACLFDLDGVLTQTAKVHAAAWKDMFDAYLRERSARTGEPFVPFDIATDYALYVDGKLRQDGVRSFLASRQIFLPEGTFDDPPTAETVHGLGTRKNDLVQTIIHRDGVETYPGSVRFLEAVHAAGHATAVVSASRNCKAVLEATGLDAMFDVRIDGVVAAERSLPGKPAPDTFLAAAADLAVDPSEAAVFEDAVAGVAAGRAGNFGWVVGVDRVGHAQALRDNGADVVVADLSELLEEQ